MQHKVVYPDEEIAAVRSHQPHVKQSQRAVINQTVLKNSISHEMS